MQQRAIIDEIIEKANFNPEDLANWTNEELTANIAKILPELYEAANCPKFEFKDIIGDKNDIYGQAQKSVSGGPGNYKVISKGLIYIKTAANTMVRHVVSIAGHELNHAIDYVTGNYQNWLNTFGKDIGHAFSEFKAYGWERSVGSPYFNNQQYTYHLFKLTNQ